MQKNNRIILTAFTLILCALFFTNLLSNKKEARWLTEQIELSQGLEFLEEEQYTEAEAIFLKYIENPRYKYSTKINYYLGQIQKGKENYPEALKYYEITYNLNYRKLLNEAFNQDLTFLKGKLGENNDQ